MSRHVAIVSTHPIQYQVPWILGLAKASGTDVKVYYGLIPNPRQQGTGFGIAFTWDIPLLDGYQWEVLPSARSQPDLSTFWSNSTPSIYTRLRADRPRVLILTGWNRLTLVQAWFSGLVLGIPMLVRGESNSLRARPWWVRITHRLFLGTFRGCLAIGKSSHDFYVRNGVGSDRIWRTPYFVDNTRIRCDFEAQLDHRNALRHAWGIPSDAFCFVYVGKLEPKKRILDLLMAVALLRERGTQKFHVLIVGTGELQELARAQVMERSLPVTFAGFLNQTEIARAYVASDCLVLPSDYGETWGLVVNEAMVCGRPVIVSDRVGCGPDLVTEGVTGHVFHFSDVAALADRMDRIARNPDDAHAMGERAREHLEQYSVEAAVAGTLEAIAKI